MNKELKTRVVTLAVIAVAIVLLNAALTQWVAWRLDYHPALGRSIGGLYQPFGWVGWQKWYDTARSTFTIVYFVLLVSMAAGFGGFVFVGAKKHRSAVQHEGLHGTAHWATRPEIEATGLLPKPGKGGSGVYVGGWTDPKSGQLNYLRHDGPEHVAALAPTRSGKGVGLVVPTCLSWPKSMVVNDRKGELWNLTSGWRGSRDGANNILLKFNPSAPQTGGEYVRFNPLQEVRIGEQSEVGDVQNLTTIIVDPDGKGLNDHWQKTAFAFLTGVVLHECYKARAEGKGREATLYDVLLAITDPSRPVDEYYEEMINNKHDKGGKLYQMGGTHPVVAAEGRTMQNKPENERGSVLSTAVSYLSLYRDPIVRHHTSRSDFQIMDLMNAERPVTLYLISRDEDKDRMRPLLRLIINQIVRVLLRPELEFENGRQKDPHKHRLLLMLDEFPSFGKLEIFQEALAFIAGYGIKAYLIMQDIAQLWAAYGKDETITSNCHVRVAYAPNKIETAEWLSKMSGTKTEMKWQITESGKRFGGFAESYSKSSQEVSRPLITPDEVMRLKAPQKDDKGSITEAGDMLVFVAGHAPVFGTQSLFFLNPVFRDRSAMASPQTDVIRTKPAAAVPAAPVAAAPKAQVIEAEPEQEPQQDQEQEQEQEHAGEPAKEQEGGKLEAHAETETEPGQDDLVLLSANDLGSTKA